MGENLAQKPTMLSYEVLVSLLVFKDYKKKK